MRVGHIEGHLGYLAPQIAVAAEGDVVVVDLLENEGWPPRFDMPVGPSSSLRREGISLNRAIPDKRPRQLTAHRDGRRLDGHRRFRGIADMDRFSSCNDL